MALVDVLLVLLLVGLGISLETGGNLNIKLLNKYQRPDNIVKVSSNITFYNNTTYITLLRNIIYTISAWENEPEPLHACNGDNVTFNWMVKESLQGQIEGIRISLTEPRKEDILAKFEGETKVSWANVHLFGNAGVAIQHVNKSFSGLYESTVTFRNKEELLRSSTRLTVYKGMAI